MKTLLLPSVEYLNECFTLIDGTLWWKERPEAHFSKTRTWNMWNAKHTGKEAGRIMPRKDYQYVQIGLNGSRVLAHRVIAKMCGISLDDEIDHRDGNGLNNRPENLRAANRVENSRNTQGWKKKGGIAGVRFSRTHARWQAYIRIEGKHTHLGFFDDEQSAINTRVEAEVVHYGGFAPIYRSQLLNELEAEKAVEHA